MRIPRFIKALIGCTDSESSRFALGGVLCESADGVSVMTATDGRQLVSVSYADGDDSHGPAVNCVVDGKSLAKAVSAVGRSKFDTTMRFAPLDSADDSTTSAILDNRSGNRGVASITEGRYPRYRDVFTASGGFTVAISPELMRRVLAVYETAGADIVYLWITDRQSAISMSGTAATGEVIRSVLMPKAADEDGTHGVYVAYPEAVEPVKEAVA